MTKRAHKKKRKPLNLFELFVFIFTTCVKCGKQKLIWSQCVRAKAIIGVLVLADEGVSQCSPHLIPIYKKINKCLRLRLS